MPNPDAALPYRDRRQAGRVLARRLEHLRGHPRLLVLALPRGGVPIGYEIALALGAPLDVMGVRKLGLPGHEEYAVGAIAAGGVRVMNPSESMPIAARELDAVVAREQAELARRESLYRDGRPPLELAERTVILADDGLATGSTMSAAIAAARPQQARRIIVAVPVGATDTCERLRGEADEVVCAATPQPLRAVGLWYQDFAQVGDDEVRELLAAVQPTDRSGS
jgi:putative phosphoribosyl transferase